ncbi:hypothetical protein HTZ77_42650 [Nonomuraea sp. SMC257]|uniref:LPXTG cell wall anchor domain-containing protein n=1 Tax=Nonomuraea montanisoli TaxID=2741721 RepID=A0A7Y6IGX7_9ACTN|nr:hypothetical protein [Nonomuraea montanisoli]NUW38054.1 hypothetical protein [Nonomuraea montanisoli]
MNRWRKALIGATVGMAASAAFVAASHPGQAEASLVAKYLCTGGVAGDTGGVLLEASVTPRLTTGGMLDVGWSIRYLSAKKFGSPGFFPAGSTLNLEGVVDISGAWYGQLRPKGSQDQAELVPGDFLKLPSGLSDAGSVQRPGTIRVKPAGLVVRFKPAKGEVTVNDNKLVTYTGDWNHHQTPEEYADHIYDLHTTTTKDGVAKLEFKGTQVAYIGRREPGLGPVRILLDGQTVTDPIVEPDKDRNGVPMTGTKSKEVLWTSPELQYGPHTIEVVNVEAKTAHVDAFRVTTGEITEPPSHNEAVCALQGDPGAIDVTVPGATPTSSSPTPTTPTPTVTTPTPTGTGTPTTPNPNNSSPYSHTPGTSHVSVVTGGVRTATATATVTPTRSPKPTTTRYVKAQVAKTPKGGVDTGEAPEPASTSYGLVAGGSLLLMGSATGGLLLRRRQAAHAGGGR